MPENSLDYKALFEALPGSFVVLTPNPPFYTVLAISDQLLGITGRQREQVVGKSVFEAYPENPDALSASGPASLRLSLHNVTHKKTEDQMPPVRYDILNATGVFEARYWSSSSKPVLNQQGEISYIIHTTQDITDQIQVEKTRSALGKLEQKYQLFLQAPVAVSILTGPENVVELANGQMLRLWGRTAQVIGTPLLEALPQLRSQGFAELLDQVRKTGEPFDATEYAVALRINGEPQVRYYNFVCQPYYQNPDDKAATDQAATGVFSVAHEVTEQVLARKKVEASEARFRSLAQNSPDIITRHSKDYRYVYASPGIEALTGIRAADFIGKSYWELGLGEELCRFFDAHLAHVFAHQTLHTVEYRMPEGKGYLLSRMVPECNEQGEVVSVLVLTTDISERKRTEEALQEAHQRTISILERTTDAFYALDATFHFTYVNERAAQLWGRDRDSLLGKHYWSEFPQAVGSESYYKHYQALRAGEPLHYETVSPLLDIWIDVSLYPGSEGSLSVFFRDITFRKQAEQQLRESEEQFRLFVQASSDLVYKMSPDWKQMHFLEGKDFLADTSHPSSSWLGQYIPLEDQPQVLEVIQKAIRAKSKFELEHRVIQADGSIGWTFSRAIPVPDQHGEIKAWFGAASDITERKRAEAALLESEARFRLMVDAVPVSLWITDTEGQAEYLNKHWCDYSGVPFSSTTAGEMAGHFLHPEDGPKVMQVFQEAMQTGRPWEVEQRNRSAQGAYRWFLNRAQPYRDPASGQVTKWFGISIDIHERKQAQQQLEQLSRQLASTNQELLQANQEIQVTNQQIQASNQELAVTNQRLGHINADLDNFIYTASHDLKAPILNIEGLLKVLSRKVHSLASQDEQLTRILSLMEASVNRFKETIQDLTDIARIQKQLDGASELVEVAAIVQDTLLDLQLQVAEAGAVIEQALVACPPVLFPRKNLKSVIYNLMSNALKYRDPARSPRITIACQVEGEYLVLEVRDNGLGMDTRNEDKIFGMFKRLHSHVEGTGVGLYIVKKMVENAGGKIQVESQAGVGSAFRVYFRQTQG